MVWGIFNFFYLSLLHEFKSALKKSVLGWDINAEVILLKKLLILLTVSYELWHVMMKLVVLLVFSSCDDFSESANDRPKWLREWTYWLPIGLWEIEKY